jgi:hypothetical protein
MPKKRKAITRALPPSTAPPAHVPRHRPVTETVVIHTERKKTRNADGGGSLIGKGAALPIIAGVAGGAATVYATSKLNWHPVAVAGAGAAAGLAVAASAKKPWLRQAGMGAAIGAATLGGVQLVGSLLAPKPAHAAATPSGKPKRAADGDEREAEGDGLVTRKELNDALSKIANVQKEGQKQQTCDLMSALRDEIKKVLAEGPSGAPAAPVPQPRPAQAQSAATFTYPFRAADGDDYARNAYGDFDERNAYGEDEYTRNAYGDFDQRDADPDVYRDAYGDEYRDAYGDDEYARNAYGDEYRDAYGGDEYRDAYGDEYRDAYGDEERNAYGEELAAA